MAPVELSTPESYDELIKQYDTWLFDCDGVLWHGDSPVEGVIDVIGKLRQLPGKRVVFVTNNATKSRADYRKKFDKVGIKDVHADDIYGSAYAAAVYIKSVLKLPADKKVFVIGMSGIEQELQSEGLQYTGGLDPADNTLEPFSLDKFTLDKSIGAVLCGLDLNINYTKLCKAYQYLTRNEGCAFIVTNDDSTYPASGGFLPGAGSISAPLRYALERDPISCGKPSPDMLKCIEAKLGKFDGAKTIMVGDRLNTDIAFGNEGGLSTLLVLTGVSKKSEILGDSPSPIVPKYYTESLGDFRKSQLLS